MAYVIFTANGDEIDRRDLAGPVTVGRAQDADVPVRDILLSRSHCRIEQAGEHWVVTDLGSKNGTYLGNRQVTRHQLKDGDELRIGRTRMTFRAGPFEPSPAGKKRRDIVRPADPTEALAGTVAGFLLVEPGEVERQAGAPVPQPRPPEPTAFASEDVYSMLNEIASSSWDSIQAQASLPLVMERPLPRPSGYREAPARRTRVAFSLQAPADDAAATDNASQAHANPVPARPASKRSATPRDERSRPTARWWRISAKAQRRIAVTVVSTVATALIVGAWVMAVNSGPRPSVAGSVQKTPPALRDVPRRELADITFPAAPDVPVTPAASPPSVVEAENVPTIHLTPSDASDPAAVRQTTLRSAARVAAVHFLIAR